MDDPKPEAKFDVLSNSLVTRLLHGTGRARALCYDVEPGVEFRCLLHGTSADGVFMIAYFSDHDDPALLTPTITPIQVEILREAMSPAVKLVTASAHIFGEVEWLSLADSRQLLATGEAPENIRQAAHGANIRIGAVDIQKLMLHDPSGVSKICPRSLRFSPGSFPSQSEEIDCSQLLTVCNDRLLNVCQAVENGELPGKICGRCPQSLICGHIANKVVCADIDRLGVTLTHIRDDEITTVFAAFENPVSSIKEFEDEFEKICFAKGI